jgi:hypothetical protein
MLLLVRALYNLFVKPVAVRLGVFPTSADGVAAAAVTITSFAAAWTVAVLWTQIVAAVGVTVNTQIIGLTLENFVGAPSQGEVMIGTGAVGFEVEVARVPAASGYYSFARPVLVLAGTRIAARYRTSSGAADSVDGKLLTATGF